LCGDIREPNRTADKKEEIMAVTGLDPREAESASLLDYVLAYTTLRLALGINELVHGITRLFTGSLSAFVDLTQTQFQNTPLPVWQVRSFATVVPIAELLIGILLLASRFVDPLGTGARRSSHGGNHFWHGHEERVADRLPANVLFVPLFLAPGVAAV
jgi:hypothetical protein